MPRIHNHQNRCQRKGNTCPDQKEINAPYIRDITPRRNPRAPDLKAGEAQPRRWPGQRLNESRFPIPPLD